MSALSILNPLTVIYEIARTDSVRFCDALDSIVENPSTLGAKGPKLRSEVTEIRKRSKLTAHHPRTSFLSG